MIGSIGMAVGMFAIGTLAFMKVIGISTLVFIIIYTASFMMSWGPICWVLISEIFPNKIRGRAIAIAVAAQWAANYLISSTYPAMMELSGGMTYCFYGLLSLLSFIFVWKMVPETKGKTLEEMEHLWKKIKINQLILQSRYFQGSAAFLVCLDYLFLWLSSLRC